MIKYDDGNNRDLIYQMWQRNFHDPADYAHFYFDEIYGKNEVMLFEKEEEYCGMIHHNPYIMRIHQEDYDSNYIVGVATDEDYRRQGIMRTLLRESFHKLREKGNIFTYLMPADERYYLPFAFRFAMRTVEQEIDYQHKNIPVDANYRFCNFQEVESEAQKIAEQDNVSRDAKYSVHTKITADYLVRMNLEAKSEYARMIVVYDQENYIGRCIIGAEDNYMALAQISMAKGVDPAYFLSQVMTYCENRYHFGYYRIIAEENLLTDILSMRERYGFRMMSTTVKPSIMFRILQLEKAAQMIQTDSDQNICFTVTDQDIPEQNGIYRFSIYNGKSSIEKVEKLSEQDLDGGVISIQALTSIIFEGYQEGQTEDDMSVTEPGKAFLKTMKALQPVCITEIV